MEDIFRLDFDKWKVPGTVVGKLAVNIMLRSLGFTPDLVAVVIVTDIEVIQEYLVVSLRAFKWKFYLALLLLQKSVKYASTLIFSQRLFQHCSGIL